MPREITVLQDSDWFKQNCNLYNNYADLELHQEFIESNSQLSPCEKREILNNCDVAKKCIQFLIDKSSEYVQICVHD